MEAILELYAEPYYPRYPVVCFDEKLYQLVSRGYLDLNSPGL